MKATRLISALAMFLILAGTLISTISTVSAATLHGKIYDIELNELNDVIVEVDSSPTQRYVSKDGGYLFKLDPGEYLLTAKYSPDAWGEQTMTEKVSITKDGDYVFDLFVFPDFDKEDEAMLIDEDVIDVPEKVVDEIVGMPGLNIAIIAVVVIILLLIIYYFIGRIRTKEIADELDEAGKMIEHLKPSHVKEKHETSEKLDDTDLERVIEVIKQEGGRTTQKELRKQIPLSEAKISLMISELEHKKIVQKVKKGRGNIIILKKK